jgi:hypothetical protein
MTLILYILLLLRLAIRDGERETTTDLKNDMKHETYQLDAVIITLGRSAGGCPLRVGGGRFFFLSFHKSQQ